LRRRRGEARRARRNAEKKCRTSGAGMVRRNDGGAGMVRRNASGGEMVRKMKIVAH
jgi:hypothetical protein